MFKIAVGRIARPQVIFDARPSLTFPSCSQAFHTSPPAQESYRKRQSRIVKKRNTEKTVERNKHLEESRPHPALGLSPGDEAKWESCDLARILVSPKELEPLPALSKTGAPFMDQVPIPDAFNFGIGPAESKLLFRHLPRTTFERIALPYTSAAKIKAAYSTEKAHKLLVAQVKATELMTRITSLSNASAKGIAFENRRRIIAEFSAPGKPNDTGRSEVQAALLTMKIRRVWSHLTTARGDIHTRRTLRTLIHQRAKVLKYLRRVDRDRYITILERIGVDPRAVEGEIVVR